MPGGPIDLSVGITCEVAATEVSAEKFISSEDADPFFFCDGDGKGKGLLWRDLEKREEVKE